MFNPSLSARMGIWVLAASALLAGAAHADDASAPATDDAPKRTVVLPIRIDLEDKSDAERLNQAVVKALATEGLDAAAFDSLPEVMRTAYEGDAAACDRSDCLTLIADATSADYVVYGAVTPSEVGAFLELKLFSAAAGRPLSRSTGEAPTIGVILPAMGQIAAQLVPTEPEPEPEVAEEKEEPPPWLFTSPLFISGVAVAMIGTVISFAGAAYALDANQTLATPRKSAALKQDALDTGMYGIYAGIAGIPIALVGAGIAGVTAAFLAPEAGAEATAEPAAEAAP